jgi:urease accessory protein
LEQVDGEHPDWLQEQKERQMKKILISLGGLVAMAGGAEAHVGLGHTQGFVHGFMHPVGGADHVLAMVAVGLFAAVLGGRARVAVPLTFMAMMVAGGLLGMSGFALPFGETGIALSVVVLGVVLAMQWKASVAVAMSLVGVFAVFHGFAHGAEMPTATSGLGYGAGFVVATGLLHFAGLMIGQVALTRVVRFGGVAIGVAGLGLVTGLI